jgi:hypothetical protein
MLISIKFRRNLTSRGLVSFFMLPCRRSEQSGLQIQSPVAGYEDPVAKIAPASSEISLIRRAMLLTGFKKTRCLY